MSGQPEKSIGEKVINEIIKQPMFTMRCPEHPGARILAVWNANAASQIEALIAEHMAPPPPRSIAETVMGWFGIRRYSGYAEPLGGAPLPPPRPPEPR